MHSTPLLAFSIQRIAYAKSKSDAVAKEDGTYKPRPKKKVEEEPGEGWQHVCVFV